MWDGGAGAHPRREEGGHQLYRGDHQAGLHPPAPGLRAPATQGALQAGRSHRDLRDLVPGPAVPELQGHPLRRPLLDQTIVQLTLFIPQKNL